jgi:hypothetical protein
MEGGNQKRSNLLNDRRKGTAIKKEEERMGKPNAKTRAVPGTVAACQISV